MIVAGTGHRPFKLGGYGPRTFDRLVTCAEHSIASLLGCDLVISGMALGWDQALAQAAINLKIPFHAYIPFTGQEWKWPDNAKARYHRLLWDADKIIVCSKGEYSAQKMQIRNERMVDAADLILALWDGTEGGTANCIHYAYGKKPIENCWEYYQKLFNADGG